MSTNNGDPDQTPIPLCTFCLCLIKRTLGLYGFCPNKRHDKDITKFADTAGVDGTLKV